MLVSFAFCLLLFLLIGLASVVKNRHTTIDYLVTGHNTSPWVVALSAVATNNSGYMFIGMIGYTVSLGLASVWLLVGWILGDFFTSLYVHARVRKVSEQQHQVSYAGVLAALVGGNSRWLARLAGGITILFLSTYAAAQLAAGGKSLHVVFGWDFSVGASLGAIAVLAYCFVGGIRASFWTDVAQSAVMIVAMAGLAFVGLQQLGGWAGFVTQLHGLEPEYLYWFPRDLDTAFAVSLFLASWLAAGVGVVGQPHIMLRFLALDDPKHISRVRLYYYSWYIAFSALTVIVGMLARLLLPGISNMDPELALPTLALQLLHPAFAGLVLAGLFAATMSTADSQIMACSASLTHDFSRTRKPSYWFVKGATLAIAGCALLLALYGPRSVFRLVLLSWSGMGSAFAPIILFTVLGVRVSVERAIFMMLVGLAGAVVGKQVMPSIYEVLPGMVCGMCAYLLPLKVYSRKST